MTGLTACPGHTARLPWASLVSYPTLDIIPWASLVSYPHFGHYTSLLFWTFHSKHLMICRSLPGSNGLARVISSALGLELNEARRAITPAGS